MVYNSLDGHVYALLDENNDAAAGTGCRVRAKMEQNRLRNGSQFVLLGLHVNTGTSEVNHLDCTKDYLIKLVFSLIAAKTIGIGWLF